MQYIFLRKDVVKRRVTVSATLVAESPLRVGSGQGETDPASPAKLQLLKLNGVPVIPGSSWKGLFRSTGERVARGRGLRVCSGLSKENCVREGIKDELQEYLKEGEFWEALALAWDKLCLNCKLFGTMSVRSQLTFKDSVLKGARTGVRTIVAISRTEGAVARGALATVEYVEPGAEIPLEVLGTNLPNYALGYLVLILRELHTGGTQVGGFKSRGFGFVRVKDIEMRVEGGVREEGGRIVLEKVDEDPADREVYVEKALFSRLDAEKFFKYAEPLVEVFEHAEIKYPQ
ncbi:CRISPR-associated RAMP protein [Infirmifilum lucidum]|uniref:CRISPR-associated RAMP protein n=1 Tax=Infirmifilum lucidum TaxID=2776706 RepID=A0A7L9FG62_9CREN|nr:CRISPR-associated RAMP protein Csx7 [Infirmifilum lucidum]QOJ78808.1 CRISPR-associated RAMP protein [Infirmifilum lucidum]